MFGQRQQSCQLLQLTVYPDGFLEAGGLWGGLCSANALDRCRTGVWEAAAPVVTVTGSLQVSAVPVQLSSAAQPHQGLAGSLRHTEYCVDVSSARWFDRHAKIHVLSETIKLTMHLVYSRALHISCTIHVPA